jgi:hypothetical protein
MGHKNAASKGVAPCRRTGRSARVHGQRAQSAMEYLMTYGWSILIIAVVLGALFQLGIFNGSIAAGNACLPGPGYLCKTPQLITDGTLTFSFGQNTGYPLYNLQLACAASQTPSGPNPLTAFRSISATGAVLAPSSTGNTITNGQVLIVSSLPCYDATGTQLSNPSMGAGFSGYLWVNYTTGSAAASLATNPWHTVKAITIKTVVT